MAASFKEKPLSARAWTRDWRVMVEKGSYWSGSRMSIEIYYGTLLEYRSRTHAV